VRAIASRAGPAQPDSDARDRFLDEASHELRTPITALKGQLQLMQRRLRKDPSRHDDAAGLDRMLYQVQRLNHQLDVLLAATHLQQRRYALLLAPCDIVAIVRQLVAVYAAGVSTHSLQFETSLTALVGEWDRRRIEEAVAALLSNAVKYSPGGTIVVLVTCHGEKAHVEVQDEGIGVLASDRSSIFHAYTTGSMTESTGLGLGLYIAQEAIRRQHGRIGVRSSRKGGSSFWFDLPLHQPQSRRERSSSNRRSNQNARETAPGNSSGHETAATHKKAAAPSISVVVGV
jgi:two-component system, chemotaxis family, CheB/CheR fusion protein